jgi:hypothetical protein
LSIDVCECRFNKAGVGRFGAGRAGSHASHKPQWQWQLHVVISAFVSIDEVL